MGNHEQRAETLHTLSQLLDHGEHESVYPSSLFITIFIPSTAPPNPLIAIEGHPQAQHRARCNCHRSGD